MKDNTKCLLIVIGLVIIAAGVQLWSSLYMESTTFKKMTDIHSSDSIFHVSLINILDKNTDRKIIILKNQYDACQKIKDYYNGVGITYFRNYYAFSICSVLFTTLLAIASFLVINDGWQKAGIVLKTFFLTTILISSFYFFLENVLENKKNLATNLQKAKIFQHTQFNILYFANSPDVAKTDSLNKFLKNNYADIAENLDLLTTDINTDELGGNPGKDLRGLKK